MVENLHCCQHFKIRLCQCICQNLCCCNNKSYLEGQFITHERVYTEAYNFSRNNILGEFQSVWLNDPPNNIGTTSGISLVWDRWSVYISLPCVTHEVHTCALMKVSKLATSRYNNSKQQHACSSTCLVITFSFFFNLAILQIFLPSFSLKVTDGHYTYTTMKRT